MFTVLYFSAANNPRQRTKVPIARNADRMPELIAKANQAILEA
jgi:hypothetical protein